MSEKTMLLSQPREALLPRVIAAMMQGAADKWSLFEEWRARRRRVADAIFEIDQLTDRDLQDLGYSRSALIAEVRRAAR